MIGKVSLKAPESQVKEHWELKDHRMYDLTGLRIGNG